MLQQRYTDAAARLEAKKSLISVKTLAEELGIKAPTVNSYLRLHPDLIKRLGVEIKTMESTRYSGTTAPDCDLASLSAQVRKSLQSESSRPPTTPRHRSFPPLPVPQFPPTLTVLHGVTFPSLTLPEEGRVSEYQLTARTKRPDAFPLSLRTLSAEDMRQHREPSWKWTVGTFNELTTTYHDVRVERIVLGKVRTAIYRQLWDKGLLEFQRNGQPKPEHLPTPKELERFLKNHSRRTSS